MKIFSPVWGDYELIDSGGYEKLERFGKYVISRPEPQAIWSKGLSDPDWHQQADAKFNKLKGSADKGQWSLKKDMPEQWWVQYHLKNSKLNLRLGLTSFKHVGIFPEQADNWNFIYDTIKRMNSKTTILNLFAYTGAASLAARAAGAEVVHLDSVKQVVTWARENMEQSKLSGISWVIEDALKFVNREVKRGRKYQGIILDPPAYGRGPKGEKWLLEDLLPELLILCEKLLDGRNRFLVLNLYSMGLSPLVAESLVNSIFKLKSDAGELFFQDRAGRKLPLGVFSRFTTQA
jgi:23S rRNA (cytosine1962-C5)-methyltransferase